MKYFFYIAALILISSSLSANAEEDWKLKKDENGIQVFTRDVEGSPYDAVKAVTTIKGARLASLAALIMDAEACPKWADKCAESYVHEQLSETEFYVYSNNDMPFPVKDRDALTHVIWSQDPNTLEVVMVSTTTEGILPEIKGRLRLTDAKTTWSFKPLGNGKNGAIEVVNNSHINPGSAVPGWMTNILLVDTPFQTMKDFVTEVKSPKYSNAEVSFIQEKVIAPEQTITNE